MEDILAAKYSFEQTKEVPTHFYFEMANFNRCSIKAFCKLNPTVNGKPVKLTDFYGKSHPALIQPLAGAFGHFDIADILEKAGKTVSEMQKAYTGKNQKKQLRFKVEFSYQQFDNPENRMENPTQEYFYCFRRMRLISDF